MVLSQIRPKPIPGLQCRSRFHVHHQEVPFVLFDYVASIEKTSSAIKILKQVGAYADAEKAMGSFGIRPGKGKMRNRRYISRKGTLIVYETEGSNIMKAFRNLSGVDVAHVGAGTSGQSSVTVDVKLMEADSCYRGFWGDGCQWYSSEFSHVRFFDLSLC
ncbi:hypothetical protein KFK09_010183 [Dendrobium nobile]|uniref:Uncharacterized protein n=1 Tax=Dendrobium nobile TaxID=94219 RepID=A0A8T3BN72_DENNO|nr:hypothetical protein KFK09_010183 [Dendrobium nobile]